ncbi:MAG: DegT/DnrJ/EryC1/StrS family aminotransferase [Kiritimatiellae bacterium]|nr:DegT/DnrJ/EryC1/StrS family aminotransferase [Kiritimatiellia bacterium]
MFGGKPVRSAGKQWPAWPIWDERERRGIGKVLESGKWWYGEKVREFEEAFAAFQKGKHCVTASSGTTALETCLLALNIGAGDEVIVPAYTFMATASCVMRVGARPVFADVNPADYCVTADSVAAAITPRTRAIMPVHFAGFMADMDAIMKLARKHRLKVIEDACHAWGTVWKGKFGAGAIGDCGCFSFQASKNITAGEGGAIVTNDEKLANICRSYTNCGRGANTPWYQHFLMGSNLRLTEFHAAILLAQLGRLPRHIVRREANAKILNKQLAGIPGLYPVPDDKRVKPRSYHLFCIRFEPVEFGCSRSLLIKAAKAEGLDLVPGYPMPLYKQPMFANRREYKKMFLPGTEKLCRESALWFRHHLLLGTRDDMRDIAAIFRKISAHAAELAAGPGRG